MGSPTSDSGAPARRKVGEAFAWDDFTWTWFTRPLRVALVVIFVAWMAYLGLSDELRVCESELVVLDDGARYDTATVCRSPTVADAAVIAPAVLAALLLLPDFKVGFGGFSIERRLQKNEERVEELRTQIANIASSASTSQAVLNVGTTGLAPGASQKELQLWTTELVHAEMRSTVAQIVDRISASKVLDQQSQAVGPNEIDMKVYLHQHDGALRARYQRGLVAPADGPFDLFAPGTGLVGYVSRHQVFAGVVGTTEVSDPSDRYSMSELQRSALRQRETDGRLPSVIAASPIWHPDTGVVLGSVSCDVAWPGVGESVDPAIKSEIVGILRNPMLQASANLGAIIVRLSPIS